MQRSPACLSFLLKCLSYRDFSSFSLSAVELRTIGFLRVVTPLTGYKGPPPARFIVNATKYLCFINENSSCLVDGAS